MYSSNPRRGRGRGYRGSSWSKTSSRPSSNSTESPADRNLHEGLKDTPVKTLAVPRIDSTDQEVKIKDVEYIGSYNWVKGTQPTMIVPGSPAIWQNKALPYQVPADDSRVFVDQNGFWMGSKCLLPLIAAVDTHAEEEGEPPLEWSSFDIITDRNGLRKLLRWIGGAPDARDFRIDLQLAGEKTVLFNRWEKKTTEESSGYTFGHNFERVSTHHADGCEESTGHHRIVKYDLNGLKMVVRFEVDACLPDAKKSTTVDPRRPSRPTIDDLADLFSKTTLATSKAQTVQNIPFGDSSLTIKKAGSAVPHKSVIELSTISVKRVETYNWDELFPQLFLSQTENHFLAVHRFGLFEQVQKRTLSGRDLQEKEARLQSRLQKLVRALHMIKDMVVEHGERSRLSVVFERGQMRVFERKSDDDCLPENFMKKFAI
ncbi:hypothetical protein K435DRAFT_831724 [Dendrothele bispora CBS 962.96]|uniref:Geranylgeranyl pyrophosphate synthetase n=1 Tax=Dendrothele bispora (strain CBS 962.96) TaxID=1314807 RepID=A0A4V4HC76_DENBC|nr:hypothetical protein K435DRAFT_831724 [Dendrothele bispora CBS 962.96]